MVTSTHRRHHTVAASRVARLLPFVVLCCAQFGCKSTLDMSNLKSFGRDKPEEQYASAYEEVDDRSPLEKILQTVGQGRREAARRNYRPAEGVAEFEQAEALFDRGEFKKSEKQFKRIAKKYRDTQIEEDALFMRAESQFESKSYSWAQDGYGTLFEKFPSTRYMNRATERLFTIARIWLRSPDVVTSGDIQQVNFDDPKATPKPKTESDRQQRFQLTRAVPILPNLLDRSRPVFDTEGRALQALKSIWMHDPTGPRADDALMLTASYHLRNGDHLEAARVYTILREQYPKSQHLQNAFVLGSHVQLMSYQGDKYDGRALDEAEQLMESTLRIFPDAKESGRLKESLVKVAEAQAARDWEMVTYYNKKNKPQAVAVWCREIIRNHPTTSYAQKAREKLEELRAEAAAPPGLGQRLIGAVPRFGRTQTSEKPVTAAPQPAAEDGTATPPLRKRLLNRLPRVPRLLRIPGGAAGNDEDGQTE